MTRRHLVSFGCGLLALFGGFVAAGLPAVAASPATIDDAGWWWKAKQGPLGAAPIAPPNVQAGQLLVQGAADGATALAAVRATLPEGQANPVLTLAVAPDGDQGGDAAILLACQTGSSWSGGDAQAWDSKPKPDCSVSVQGQRAPDGSTWIFPLGALQFGNQLNVILVSGTDPALPEGANGSVFSLTFEKPTSDSITTTGGEAPASSFPSSDEFASDGYLAQPNSDTGTFAPPIGSGTFAVAPVQPALATEDQGLTATAPRIQAGTPAPTFQPVASLKSDGARAFGALILILAGACSWWFGQQAPPVPRKLGRFAAGATLVATIPAGEAEVGGLGRFARVRSGPAPRL